LPLLVSRPTFPALTGENWQHAEFFLVGREFLFGVGNDPAAILLQARTMVALLGVGLGILVFVVSRRLFGDLGGLISLTVFTFCPHMLAHGALVSTDLTATFALFAATWFAWRLLHVVSWSTLIGCVVAFSILVISKMSAVLIVPIAGILIVVRLFNRDPWRWRLGPEGAIASRPRQALVMAVLVCVHALAGWATIWAAFDFKYLARGDPADTQLTLMQSPDAKVGGVINDLSTFCHRHRLLPEGYLRGMEELVGISKRRPSFMNGHWKAGGQPLFFPYAFWAKTSPALLGLAALGLGAILVGSCRRQGGVTENMSRARGVPNADADAGPENGAMPWVPRYQYEVIPLVVLFILYAAVAARQDVNIGHRHLLPVYPVLYVFAGAVALLLPRRLVFVAVGIAVLLGWHIAESIGVRPNYLAYFSPVVGGPAQGYRRLADSSLDWGQDLPGLSRWLSGHNADEAEPVFFSYFGTGSPEYYGITSKRLPGFPEWRPFKVFAYTPGIYAVSATMFQQLYATTFGPWNRLYEDEYQVRSKRVGLTEENTKTTELLGAALLKNPEELWQQDYGRYEKLRFGRLCAWLRATHRVPDAEVGYSILIWKLDAHDLHEALWGKPLELYEAPASELPNGI
jgi:4-amino-4-deoxy-L-arabinose transferase-like glycosyltransferase